MNSLYGGSQYVRLVPTHSVTIFWGITNLTDQQGLRVTFQSTKGKKTMIKGSQTKGHGQRCQAQQTRG